MKLEFFRQIFEKILQYFMQIRPVGAELFMRADGRTDVKKLAVAFPNFVNAKTIYISKNTRTIFQMVVVTTCTIWCYIFELFVLPRDVRLL